MACPTRTPSYTTNKNKCMRECQPKHTTHLLWESIKNAMGCPQSKYQLDLAADKETVVNEENLSKTTPRGTQHANLHQGETTQGLLARK